MKKLPAVRALRSHFSKQGGDGPDTVPVDQSSKGIHECLIGASGVIHVMKILDRGVPLSVPIRFAVNTEGRRYPGVSIGTPIPFPCDMFTTNVVGILLGENGCYFVYTHPRKSPRDCRRSFDGCSCYVMGVKG